MYYGNVSLVPYFLFGAVALLSWIVQKRLQSKFKKYSQIPTRNNITGKEVAEKMLRENGIYDVQVISVSGQLTDHYNPTNKTINLSEPVYGIGSVAAAAVAAHETGHAVQHAAAYGPLKVRSKLVPVVSIASKWLQWILLGGIVLINTFPQLMLAGIILFACTTLFSLVTLPVEIDASRRALVWLKTSGITDQSTQKSATDALKAAAYTYVVAALSSMATLFYYVMIYLGRRR